ncbi:LptF/LptG family permease [Bacteroides sp. OF04-15BH]|jgi:lipopolysaccharide export system permease protein|uniref:LptF/LptG family permease n=1 Tax=Bacteroides sp. OF04-15BH TaxID=2292281 RepID=UPI000E4D9103|nr:LptF/LptG family permease [Bacteroides sp. OF04-15BH]RHP62681.1 YjgP/YjgQ family permease [Bacteroides sp. OF04-15BH]
MKLFKKKNKDNSDRRKPLGWLSSVKLLNRLDRYLIAKFLGTYFFSIILIISIAIVFDYNENIDKFTTNNAPLKGIIFDYYLNFVPYFSNLFSPLFVFISVIFFTSKLAENSEIIAMMSTGMSFERLMRPYMISAAIIALLSFVLGSYVIPQGSEKRLNFENIYKKKQRANFAQNVQLQVDTGVIAFIEHFDGETKTGYRFSLDKFENKKLVSHLTASTIKYDTLADEQYHWKISNYTIREMKGMRERITSGSKLDSLIMMEPADFLETRNQQEILTNPELKVYIEKQKRRGLGNVKPFEVEYYKRYATPFASFILTTIGLSLSARKRKGGMGLYLGIGLALSASYILFQTISSTLAINADWPSALAVWLPNIIFTIIAFFLYKKAPR